MVNAQTNAVAKIAAIVAGLGLVAMSFALAAPAAKADTTTMQTPAAYNFATNLTIGSRGADVTALQTWLISQGYQIPAGATGYFGGQTKAAVAAYQTNKAISPAVGYFGPLTRASVNAHQGSTGGTTSTNIPGCGNGALYSSTTGQACGTSTSGGAVLTGGDGKFENLSTLGDVTTAVDEDSSGVKVLGLSLDAKDSDLSIQRVDATFDLSGSTGSTALTKYITSASLWLDGKKLATMNASDASKNGKVYTMRFSGLNGVVKNNATGKLYVSVDSISSIGSAENGKNVIASIPTDGVRAINGAGVTDTYVASTDSITETFQVNTASTGTLSITEGSTDPKASLVKADANNTTENVTLLSINLKAKNQDIDITDIPVGLQVSGTSNVSDVIQTISLMDGSTVLKSKTAGSGAHTAVVFDNINTTISKDSTKTYTVVATIKKFSGTFGLGDTLYATTSAAVDASQWDVSDSNGNSVTPSGSVTAGTLTFTSSGIAASLVSANAVVTQGGIAGSPDKVADTIVFSVTAGDDDIYVAAALSATSTPVASTNAIAWATTTDSTTGTTTSATVSANGDSSNDTASYFKIPAGSSRNITLTNTISAGILSGAAGTQITGFDWGTTTTGYTNNLYNYNLTNFKTVTTPGLSTH